MEKFLRIVGKGKRCHKNTMYKKTYVQLETAEMSGIHHEERRPGQCNTHRRY